MRMAESNLIVKGQALSSITLPTAFIKDKSFLVTCLELAVFAGDTEHVNTLSNYASLDKVSVTNAASNLEDSVVDKLFEFEDTSRKIDAATPGKGHGRNVSGSGLAKRIRLYKNRIKEATLGRDSKVTVSKIPFIELKASSKKKKEMQHLRVRERDQ